MPRLVVTSRVVSLCAENLEAANKLNRNKHKVWEQKIK